MTLLPTPAWCHRFLNSWPARAARTGVGGDAQVPVHASWPRLDEVLLAPRVADLLLEWSRAERQRLRQRVAHLCRRGLARTFCVILVIQCHANVTNIASDRAGTFTFAANRR